MALCKGYFVTACVVSAKSCKRYFVRPLAFERERDAAGRRAVGVARGAAPRAARKESSRLRGDSGATGGGTGTAPIFCCSARNESRRERGDICGASEEALARSAMRAAWMSAELIVARLVCARRQRRRPRPRTASDQRCKVVWPNTQMRCAHLVHAFFCIFHFAIQSTLGRRSSSQRVESCM